jgi:hypothetical protein
VSVRIVRIGRIVAAVTAVVAVVALAVGWWLVEDRRRIASMKEDVIEITGPLGDVSTIEVVERGFSTIPRADGTLRDGYGAVFRNTGDQVSTPAIVDFVLYKAAGSVVQRGAPWLLPPLLPGQEFGIGEVGFPRTAHRGDAASVDVSLDASTDDARRLRGVLREGVLDVSSAEFESGGPDGGIPQEAAVVNLTVASSFAESLEGVEAWAILRNEAGDIVGGDVTFLDEVPADGEAVADGATADADGEVYEGFVTPFEDVADVDVYVAHPLYDDLPY